MPGAAVRDARGPKKRAARLDVGRVGARGSCRSR